MSAAKREGIKISQKTFAKLSDWALQQNLSIWKDRRREQKIVILRNQKESQI